MIDTHSHILPGLDDGSPDVTTSLRMAAEAVAAGVSTIVCTPHLTDLDVPFTDRARTVIEELRSALAAAGIDVELLLGFEVDLNVAATARSEELWPLAIEGSNGAVIIETPQRGWPVFAREAVFRLRMAGFLPILAHPERNDRIQRSPELLTECLDAGAVAQATAASLNNEFGRSSRQAFHRHLFRGDIALLASDAHSHRHSSWALMADLRGQISEDDLNMLVTVNPGIVLSGGRPVTVMPAVAGPSWRKTVRRLRSGRI
ncbi:MAG: CpsB/CapC family capsule biosynthesis tyrosine phosphatase [bacterium]